MFKILNLKPKTYNLKPISGFTLIEMLIVIAVFSVVAVLLTGIFLSGVRLRERVSGGNLLIEEARRDFDGLARQLRFGRLDYNWYLGRSTAPADMLVFYTAQNQHIFLRRAPQLCFSSSVICLEISVDDQASWLPLTPAGLSVDDFKIYISPALDPFFKNAAGAFVNPPEQPHLTITAVFRALGRGGRASEAVVVPFQTTVSLRTYLR